MSAPEEAGGSAGPDEGPPSIRRQYLPLVGALLFVVALLVSVTSGVNSADEAYYLQVIQRAMRGELLNGGVRFGLLPLSVFVTLLPATLWGVEVRFLKAVVSVALAVPAARDARELQCLIQVAPEIRGVARNHGALAAPLEVPPLLEIVVVEARRLESALGHGSAVYGSGSNVARPAGAL